MSKLSEWERKSKIRKGEPITIEFGEPKQELTFYPVKMSNYEEFLSVKNAWTIRMTSLPVQYLSMPYLSALWAVDYDSILATGESAGFFNRIIRLLSLSLRLGQEGNEMQLEYPEDDPRKLLAIILTIDGQTVKITPQEFTNYIRPIVAEQNGIELPDESFNPDLVAEEKKISEMNSANIKYDIGTLIASVAYQLKVRERDMDEWTVLEFENARKAIERDKMFTLYRQAQLSGMVTFKGKIPYPSWCFDEEEGLTPALKTMDEMKEKVKTIGDVEVLQTGTGNTDGEIAKVQKQIKNS